MTSFRRVHYVNKIVRVRVKMIYFDKEKHAIEETNTEPFMC